MDNYNTHEEPLYVSSLNEEKISVETLYAADLENCAYVTKQVSQSLYTLEIFAEEQIVSSDESKVLSTHWNERFQRAIEVFFPFLFSFNFLIMLFWNIF